MLVMAKKIEERIEALEKEVSELKRMQEIKIRKGLGIGDTFKIAGIEWKILDITEKGYACLATENLKDMKFDNDSSDWKTSDLREYLNEEFYQTLVDDIGYLSIIPFNRNLLSLDGQTEYGSCEDRVSLLTFDEYRQYRALIQDTGYWWWLVTPFSTPCNDYSRSGSVVSPSGYVDGRNCYGDNGVRPFCIFASAIFESED
jgi:hypothetical protein